MTSEPEAAADNKNLLQKTGDALKDVAAGAGNLLHKAVDATILDMSPHGTNVDGAVRLDGAIAKDVIDHKVLDMSPHGTNVDGAVNLGHHDKK
jgi:hypothetical protein